MSNSTEDTQKTSVKDDDDGLSDTEWIVIVLVLVIVLIVLIITIAKCLEIGKDSSDKSLLENDFQSVRSGKSTARSVASSKSRAKSLKKMPLNAEITRFSAGRASRSAEYGVVIKNIGKSVNTDATSGRMSPTPPHFQHSNTMQSDPRYVQHTTTRDPGYVQQEPRYVQHPMMPNSLSSPPNASVIVDRQYATTGTIPQDSRAVFVAPDGPYYNATPAQTLPSQAPVPLQLMDMGQTYQVVGPRGQSQPVILMQ